MNQQQKTNNTRLDCSKYLTKYLVN